MKIEATKCSYQQPLPWDFYGYGEEDATVVTGYLIDGVEYYPKREATVDFSDKCSRCGHNGVEYPYDNYCPYCGAILIGHR